MEDNPIKTIGRYSYFIRKMLGEGSFGKVFEGYENSTREKVAIKKVDFKTIEADVYLEKAIHEQIKILSKFKHPNIVRLYEVLNSKRSLYIIMDYCKDGDLKKYLKSKCYLAEQEAFAVMKQVICGYQELAKESIIHRDLKPANILIHNGVFKICDFGFSKVIKDPNAKVFTCVGSPVYMAPQILQKKDYSAKCDIWSLGVIFYELLYGEVPWKANSQKQLLTKIKTQAILFTKTSPEIQKIIEHMLEISEQKRASLRDLERYFNLDKDSVMKANHSYLNLSDQLIDDNPLPQSGFKSMSSIQMKVLNRNYFEELAWRHFVCIQIRIRLSFLNSYNFKPHIFQRYIMLLISSCVCNFQRRLPDIERIHESDVRFRVKKELECYINFRNDFVKLLADNFSTWQISKEFDLEDIFRDNFTKDVMQMAELDLLNKSDAILKQLEEEIKTSQDPHERNELLYIAELILDLLALNQRQARFGLAEVETVLAERGDKPIEKRVATKLRSRNTKKTEFF